MHRTAPVRRRSSPPLGPCETLTVEIAGGHHPEEAILARRSSMSGRPKPRVVLEFLSRCGHEDFVAWWEVEKPRDPHEAMWVITLNRSSGIFTVSSFPVKVHHWSHQV